MADATGGKTALPLQRAMVGYDTAIFPALVVGAEIEIERVGIVDDRSGFDTCDVPGGHQNLSMSGRIGTRAGRALVYGKVGYANFRIDDPLASYVAAAPAVRLLNGVPAGLGTELAVTSHTFVNSEWRYTAYQAGPA